MSRCRAHSESSSSAPRISRQASSWASVLPKKLRSLTAETVFRDYSGWEVASAGTERDALTPLIRDLLEWVDVAVCMQKQHRDWIRGRLKGALTDDRILILGIPDDYEYMEPELVELLTRLVPGRLDSLERQHAADV